MFFNVMAALRSHDDENVDRESWKITKAFYRLRGKAMLLACVVRHAMRGRCIYTLDERLAMFPRKGLPIEKPVAVSWNRHHVPFIEAETDDDAAVALGIVHAHLRLGQLELMRRIAQGRVSELIGSSGIQIDQLLRTLDFGRAVPGILAQMPPATRQWLDAFVRGLNHHLAKVRRLPPEFDLFGMQPEAWSTADILALGRLVSADVNWIVWFQLLRFRADDDWPRLWRNILSVDSRSCWTNEDESSLAHLAAAGLRCGSNSFVVAPDRSATGGALIGSDPHLSIILPNTWLVAAFKSPSYHAAGLMIPGLPFVALGRNPWIAWGGTSLHAASSDLVAVPPEHVSGLAGRKVEIPVRWEQPHKFYLRDSEWGPVITDVLMLAAGTEPLALRWMGHRPSDETTAMLAVNRARNWTEFRAALDGFAVPGQNMTYADAAGHIGRGMAVHLPRRSEIDPSDMVVRPGPDNEWNAPMTGSDLLCTADPAEHFLASANERPPPGSPFIGRHFSRPDRKQRLDHLLRTGDRIARETAGKIQRDVYSAAALTQCRQILAWFRPALARRNPRARRILDDMIAWDGRYDATSRGALAFEVVCHHLIRILVPGRHRAAYSAAWGTHRLLWNDVLCTDLRQRQRALHRGLLKAARSIGSRDTWGTRHRLRLAHPLGLLPIAGRPWRFMDLPVGGSNDTLMKTAHPLTDKRHGTRYGSVARHISDLSDLDQNYFVLLGGQDGFLGSTTCLDQVSLWQEGKYIAVPLRPATARATFKHHTDLEP